MVNEILPLYEMRITVELKGEKEALLRGYESVQNILENLQLEEGFKIKVSEPGPAEEIPPEVTKWVLTEKQKLSFKDLTLAILSLRDAEGLTKPDLEAKGGRIGVDVARYHDWLDKTFMSSHGGLKGLVVPRKLSSGMQSYSLSALGKRQAKMLIERVRKEYPIE